MVGTSASGPSARASAQASRKFRAVRMSAGTSSSLLRASGPGRQLRNTGARRALPRTHQREEVQPVRNLLLSAERTLMNTRAVVLRG
jgi:hypothetical protein